MAKELSYSKGDEVKDGMTAINERLSRDLHDSVRKLDDYRVFSEQWLIMVDSLSRMATGKYFCNLSVSTSECH